MLRNEAVIVRLEVARLYALVPVVLGRGVMDRPGWVSDDVDITVPNAARVYDFALGGYHNFEVDRAFYDRAEQMWPGVGLLAYANRAYLRRVVQWLVDAGVRQFLDIGSGIPTLGNVHEVAQQAAVDARVVYVDIDPVAVSHAQSILAGNRHAGAIRGDLRQPQMILGHPEVTGLLDFAEPVAVLMIAVLHFVPDDDKPGDIISQYSDAVVSGSYFALSHGTRNEALAAQQEKVRDLYNRTPTPFFTRTPAQVADLLAGLELVEPGIVAATDWHPDPDDEEPPQPSVLAAVARKPTNVP